MGLPGWQIAFASVENFFLFNAVLSAAAFAIAYLLRRGRVMRNWRPDSCARVYFAALVLPPAISAWLVCASLFPALWLGRTEWVREHVEKHSLHLLNAFTVSTDPLLGYVAITFTLLALVAATWATWRAYFRVNGLVAYLGIGGGPVSEESIREVETFCREHGIEVGLVVSHYPIAFVWGYFKSKLVVSTGLLNALTKEELIAVLEHEAAHHARRDNLLKCALTVCRYATPVFPLTAKLHRWLNEQVEMVCDEVAVARAASPVDLAGALVRIKRLSLTAGRLALRLDGSGFFADDQESFERRVTRALSLEGAPLQADTESLSRSCIRTAVAGATVFALSMVAFFFTAPLAVHRALEEILRALRL